MIVTKINDLDLSVEVVLIKEMSTIALNSTLNVSETVRDRGLVPMTTNRKWAMGTEMVM